MTSISTAVKPARAARARPSLAALSATKSIELFAIFAALARANPTAKEIQLVRDWILSFNRRRALSLLEYTALLYVQRTGFAANHLPELEMASERALSLSHEALAGTPGSPFDRLPEMVLVQASAEDKLFYETVFAQGSRALIFRGPASEFFTRLQASSFWNVGTFAWVLAALCLSVFAGPRALLLGLVIGVAGASFNEYLVHLGVGHASDALALVYRRLGWSGRYAEEITLAHRVHHAKMTTDFRVEFTEEKTRVRVDAYLRKEARAIVEGRVAEGITPADQLEAETARIISDVKRGGYGVNGTTIGCISMQVLALPYFLLNFLLAPYLGGWIFALSATFFLSAFIAQSMYSHRYLHLSHADQAAAARDGTGTRFMLWFLRTPIGRLQVRRHYRHHQEKIDYARTVNGVIMSFNVADFFLRGGVVEAEVPHLLKMRTEGFL